MNPNQIGDYGLIGDCETAALVGRDGSIDWLCLPRFDSQACFARLLGRKEHGYWRIAPSEAGAAAQQRYIDDTLVLETRYATASGEASVTDFMPLRAGGADVVRIARGLSGSVEMQSDIAIRFDYGRLMPLRHKTADGFTAIAGPDGVVVRTNAAFSAGDHFSGRFTLAAGQSAAFVLSHYASHLEPRPAICAETALAETLLFWREWSGRCAYQGAHRDVVMRSLITLKALTHEPTGGIIAAPTTSLPEHADGARNWDYRFCWLRDATFLLLAMLEAGYVEEANAWRRWLVRAAAGDPSRLQPLYGVAGEPRVEEWVADWLPGFAGAAPVRIGNAAFAQFQLDVYGEILDVLHQARERGVAPMSEAWALQRALCDHIVRVWDKPDAGIWESRGAPRHFTHSKMMAWAGLDRCVRAADRHGLEAPAQAWRAARDEIHGAVLTRGYSDRIGAFTRDFESEELDASVLAAPQLGFIEANDPRMVSTVAAIERGLMHDGFVRRYDTRVSDDGVGGGEGAFLLCSCWLADAYILQGRHEDAEILFERLLGARNHLGLFSEMFDPATSALMGNFPQALTHVGAIDTAFNLARVNGPAALRGDSETSRSGRVEDMQFLRAQR